MVFTFCFFFRQVVATSEQEYRPSIKDIFDMDEMSNEPTKVHNADETGNKAKFN